MALGLWLLSKLNSNYVSVVIVFEYGEPPVSPKFFHLIEFLSL